MRPSYTRGVEYIALNDEPTDYDPESVQDYVTVGLLAYMMSKEPLEVAEAVVRFRIKHENLLREGMAWDRRFPGGYDVS